MTLVADPPPIIPDPKAPGEPTPCDEEKPVEPAPEPIASE
jgi:hypothetical protein